MAYCCVCRRVKDLARDWPLCSDECVQEYRQAEKQGLVWRPDYYMPHRAPLSEEERMAAEVPMPPALERCYGSPYSGHEDYTHGGMRVFIDDAKSAVAKADARYGPGRVDPLSSTEVREFVFRHGTPSHLRHMLRGYTLGELEVLEGVQRALYLHEFHVPRCDGCPQCLELLDRAHPMMVAGEKMLEVFLRGYRRGFAKPARA